MKPASYLALSVACILMFFASCSKKDAGSTPTTPTPTTPTPPVTKHISLATALAQEEVIISDSGGKVLLDTIPPYPATLVAALPTAQTLLDITLIWYDTPESNYSVTTYKAVDLTQWTSLKVIGNTNNYGLVYPQLSATNADVVYKNTPSNPGSEYLIGDFIRDYDFTQGSPVSGYLNANYQSYNLGNWVYLLFPYSGLYNFHQPQSPTDTVDLTNMSTATTLNYTKPAGFTGLTSFLYGLMDTTDISRTVCLYANFGNIGLPDVEYPTTSVQKMELYMSFYPTPNDYIDYYSFGSTIASTVSWPSESNYTITSSQASNFAVSFSGVHPTDYSSTWKVGGNWFTLYASPDSATTNPQSMLASLKSKLLQGQDLSAPVLSSFYFETATGFDYAGLMSLEHSPALLITQRVPASLQFFHSF